MEPLTKEYKNSSFPYRNFLYGNFQPETKLLKDFFYFPLSPSLFLSYIPMGYSIFPCWIWLVRKIWFQTFSKPQILRLPNSLLLHYISQYIPSTNYRILLVPLLVHESVLSHHFSQKRAYQPIFWVVITWIRSFFSYFRFYTILLPDYSTLQQYFKFPLIYFRLNIGFLKWYLSSSFHPFYVHPIIQLRKLIMGSSRRS